MEEAPAIPLTDDVELLLERSERRLAVPERLLNLEELDVLYDETKQALWTFMRPKDRPSFTRTMLTDFEAWQSLIKQGFGPGRLPLRYLVLGSRAPGVFCFGGDLALFHQLIRERDREALAAYGYRCVEILDRNMHALDLPMLTIGLVQGQALGGGFESLLSFDFIIAERGSTFGLPEVTFGLFPGMGAHAILSRKLGAAMADRIILSNETYSAEEMYDLGIVHQLAPAGEGVAAVRDFMAKTDRRHAGVVNARRATRVANPIEMSEYYRIVDLWADAALQLREQDLKLMQRLASAQAQKAMLARAS
ncbi:crotonase/enoyl-CoA hydratase family protein [Novosphingobium sp. JCM 18896]|uniref:crotonase/enoyl-CoA hydratase family protein n=1 Tax=Novosphingobium sp. JCM 18896 TaxID=2989731 RepID=UPI002222767D|nr:crotonase/enoyl-CoA hydratase family protein [Novosphingobium sp. JCM 18896]MCW1428157.1 crotonase/enoyl-CoA hydratase family protein [Novosphingobium sp. JCM 18896]